MIHPGLGSWFHLLPSTNPLRRPPSRTSLQQPSNATQVTQHRHAQRETDQQWPASPQFLRAVFDTVRHAITVFEAIRNEQHQIVDFRFAFSNGVADRHMGIPTTGKTSRTITPGYVDETNFETMVKTVETGERADRTLYFNYGDKPIFLHSQYLKLNDGVVLVQEDITARKKAEEEVLQLKDKLAQQVEENYRTLFTTMNQGFCVVEKIETTTGTDGFRFVAANPAFGRHTGLPDVVGKIIGDVLPDAQPGLTDLYSKIIRTGEHQHFEHYIPALNAWMDGEVFPVQTPGQVAILLSNVTERKQAEADLRQSEARQRAVFESLPVGIGQVDADDKLLLANPEMLRFMPTGMLPSADEVNRWRWQAFHPDGRPFGPDDYPDTCTFGGDGTLAGVEMRYTPEQGNPIWTRVAGVPIRDDNDQIIGRLAVVTNIDQVKRAEATLKEADQRKDEFLAMLAHELRNPMATVRNGLSILTLTSEADSITSQTVTMMNRQVDHLVRMVDDLLDVSRISRGKIKLHGERLELGELVAGAVDAIRTSYETLQKGLHLISSPASLFVHGDATRLTQIVTNLLTNGLRYTGDQGQVWVRLTAQNGEAVLRVADDGIGLLADQLTTIFELFMQVDHSPARSQGGLGVGLTLARRLVAMHGGRLEAYSPGLGQGSEFVVYLPLREEPEPEQSPETTLTAKANDRILVIDDNADAALTLAMLLQLKGYEVYSRTSGRAGIQAAEELRPAVILCDIGMPELDGHQTARLIRQQPWGQSITLIAVTGYGQEEDRQRTKEAGFDDHLVKPVDLDLLTQRLSELTARR